MNNAACAAYVPGMMKTTLTMILLINLLGAAVPASAACYADYKAKKSQPLQLHYGVVQIPDAICGDRNAIGANIQKRISVGGWNLLNVMSVFGPEGLSQRQGSAGNFYLKY